MRLSESIRLGATLKPQGFGGLRVGDSTCAMGAAIEAAGCGMRELRHDEIGVSDGRFPGVQSQVVAVPDEWQRLYSAPGGPCPQCGSPQKTILKNITHLNDVHRLSRESIADWVSTIEQEHERQQAAEVQREQVTA